MKVATLQRAKADRLNALAWAILQTGPRVCKGAKLVTHAGSCIACGAWQGEVCQAAQIEARKPDAELCAQALKWLDREGAVK